MYRYHVHVHAYSTTNRILLLATASQKNSVNMILQVKIYRYHVSVQTYSTAVHDCAANKSSLLYMCEEMVKR